jgi:hypothetical protein
VDVVGGFAKALDAAHAGSGHDLDLLPERLARAAAAVLPVDGVGLSIHGGPDLRTPLAASSEFASAVERLQFTIGRGPCLLAATSGMPVFATEELLVRRWPAFHDLLVEKTPIRSMLALSLPGRLRGVGAMDLYFTAPHGPTAVDIFEAGCVAELVSEQLGPAADWSVWTPDETPGWLETPAARRRGRLWMAVGMVMLASQVSAPDALALLRGHAYSTDRTVDALADALVEHRIPAAALLDEDTDRNP